MVFEDSPNVVLALDNLKAGRGRKE